jgi:ABC-type branched-subunit amino acid transport system substrate-binding protein
VKVGGLASLTSFAGADIGARARFARANAAGGVNGRTIDYIGVRDDRGGGSAGADAGSALVNTDGVFAVVPVVTPDLAAAPTFVSTGTPYFGWAISSNFCGHRNGFGITGCQLPPAGRSTSDAWPLLVKAALEAAAPGSSQSAPVALLAENTPAGQYVLRALQAAAKSVGFSVVSATSNLPVPATADDAGIAHAVLAANQGGPPSAVFIVGSYSNITLLRRALRDAGFGGVVTDMVQYEPELVADAAGSSIMIQTAAVQTTSTNPAMQQLVQDVNAVAPGRPIDQAVVAGYWSADLFLAALQRAGRQLTAPRLLRTTNRAFTYVVPGTVGPTRFPAAHDVPAPCGSLVTSDGVAFSVQVAYQCGKVVAVNP